MLKAKKLRNGNIEVIDRWVISTEMLKSMHKSEIIRVQLQAMAIETALAKSRKRERTKQ